MVRHLFPRVGFQVLRPDDADCHPGEHHRLGVPSFNENSEAKRYAVLC
jgi:hypothetical protein